MNMRCVLPFVFAVGLMMFVPVAAFSQISFGVGGENVESESSTIPFKIQLTGVLNGTPKDNTLGRVMLEISTYHEMYDFDVTEAKAPDNARITSYSILQKYQHGKQNITLTGSEYWLSKIGQAAPGTPLTIIGFLRQRSGTLQLIRSRGSSSERRKTHPAKRTSCWMVRLAQNDELPRCLVQSRVQLVPPSRAHRLQINRQFQILAINEVAMFKQNWFGCRLDDRVGIGVHLTKRSWHRTLFVRQGLNERGKCR